MRQFSKWKRFSEKLVEWDEESAAFRAYKKERKKQIKKAVQKFQPKEVFYGPVQIKQIPARVRPLTNEDVLFCRRAILWMTYEQLAEKFGTSVNSVRRAVKGETYAYLNHIERPQR